MHTHRISSTVLFTLSVLTTACAGFDDGDFDQDRAGGEEAADRECAGAEGQEHGGDEEGRDCGDGFQPPERADEGEYEEPAVCEPYATELIAGQHFDTGSVTLSNTDDNLELTLDTNSPYQIVEVHAYVGVDPIPLTNGGMAAPGQFPYKQTFAEPVDSWQLSIPLAELEVGCGDDLNVAVHAVVVSFERGQEVFHETAWAFGPEQFDAGWGWHFDYEICCAAERDPGDDSCTLTQGYWKTHHAYADMRSLQQPWPISEDTQLCGSSWLDILHTEPEGDAWLILAHQAIAAQLNVASGATLPEEVEGTLAKAKQMLAACQISDAETEGALDVAAILDAYNNGDIGPGHCE
jgi:hypothetical protein